MQAAERCPSPAADNLVHHTDQHFDGRCAWALLAADRGTKLN